MIMIGMATTSRMTAMALARPRFWLEKSSKYI